MAPLETCGNCRFAKVNSKDFTKRFCRGLPPYPIAVPTPKGVAVQTIQPIVNATDHACGLYKPAFAMDQTNVRDAE